MGASTSVVVALIFVGFLVPASITYSTADYYRNLVKKAQFDQDTIKKAKMQTDITIINVSNSTTKLNLSIKNTGKTTLNASMMDVFVDGAFYNYTLSTSGNLWAPENRTNITVPASVITGSRIKVTTENGMSDYALVP